MADPITLLPMENGARSLKVEATSEGPTGETGRYIGNYTWFPDQFDVDMGPDGSLSQVDVYHVIYGGDYDYTQPGPPEDEIIQGQAWITSAFVTFDVSGLSAATVANAVLEIDLAAIWLHSDTSQSSNPDVTSDPGGASSTRTVAVDYIAGTTAELADIGDIATAKLASWPYNADVGTIDLSTFLSLPDVAENYSPGTIQLPFAGFADAIEGKDWLSVCFVFNTRPWHFWRHQQWEDFDDEGDPYEANYYYNQNDSAYVLVQNPVTGYRLVVNADVAPLEEPEDDPRRRPAIILAADVPLAALGGGLTISGRAVNPVDRRILSHAARRRRGW